MDFVFILHWYYKTEDLKWLVFLLVYTGGLVTAIFKWCILENGYWVSDKEKTDFMILTVHLEKAMGKSCYWYNSIFLLVYIHEALGVTGITWDP